MTTVRKGKYNNNATQRALLRFKPNQQNHKFTKLKLLLFYIKIIRVCVCVRDWGNYLGTHVFKLNNVAKLEKDSKPFISCLFTFFILSLEVLLTLLLKCIKSDKGSWYYPSSKPHNDILNFFGRLTPWRLINVTLNNEIQSEELCKFPLKL